MLGRLAAGPPPTTRRRRAVRRARALSSRYLADAARPTSVRWVGNQMSRWGSCTPADGTIRVSERLKGMPGYVLDYVLLHELAHLLRPAHDREFWRLLAAYPRVERARGYLEGIAARPGSGLAGRRAGRPARLRCGSGRRGLRADDALLAPRQVRRAADTSPISSSTWPSAGRPPATTASSDSALTRGTAPGGAVAA